MLRIVLIDDEEYVLEETSYLLKSEVEVVGKFTNPLIALEKLEELAPDAVFLDIEMPGIGGLAVGAEILTRFPGIIVVFLTAYSQYAVEAFEVNAIDYLLKPVRRERLQQTIKRIEERLGVKQKLDKNKVLKNWLYSSLHTYRTEKIPVWHGKQMVLLDIQMLVCCFVAKNERRVTVFAAGQTYHAAGSLQEFISRLGGRVLVQCHRSYYINPAFVSRLVIGSNNTMTIYLEGFAAEIPVSRAYRQEVFAVCGKNV